VLPLHATTAFAASAHGLEHNEPAVPDPRRVAGAEPGLPGIRPPTRTRFSACCSTEPHDSMARGRPV
jgi:hypothetical protein